MLFLPFACGWRTECCLSHCLQTDEAVTYSPDSYGNGAVSAPRPLPPPESFQTSSLLLTLSLVPFHPEHALNSKVTDNSQDGSAVMAGDRLQAGGEEEEEELPFSQVCGWSTQSSTLGWTENELRAHRLELGSELSGISICSAVVGVCCRTPAEEKVVRPQTAGKIPMSTVSGLHGRLQPPQYLLWDNSRTQAINEASGSQ